MPGEEPYTITLDLQSPMTFFSVVSRVLLVFQLLSLISNLFKNAGTIKKTLRPIQDLAAAAARLNTVSGMSPENSRPWRASWTRSTPPTWIPASR